MNTDRGATPSPDHVDAQVALVTGGGRGIGRAIAACLAAAGAAVAVVARSDEQLAETVGLIERGGGRALAVAADVTDRAAVERAVRATRQELGPIDLLVNDAAVVSIAPIWEADPDEWWRCLEVNLFGTFLCTRAVLPEMIARRRGRIVNVASGAAYSDHPYLSAYASSKAAVVRFTSNLAAETGEHGLAAFAISPGGVDTTMQAEVALAPSPEWQRWRSARPQQFVPAEWAGRLVVALASGRADRLTGRMLSIDDDIDDLVQRVDQVARDDLFVVRRRTWRDAPPGPSS